MDDAILRIPRDARVRAYSTRDTYDGVVPVTSKRQPYCHSSYIELSGLYPALSDRRVCVTETGSWKASASEVSVNDTMCARASFAVLVGQS